MRWYIEVSGVGDTAEPQKLCLEASAWQGALQEVRKQRGDTGPVSKLSIEAVRDGYRATDLKARVRYVVSKAPADAPLQNGANGVHKSVAPAGASAAPASAAPAPVVAAAPAAPAAPADSAPRPSAGPPRPSVPVSAPPTEKMSGPPAATVAPVAAAAPAPVPAPAPALVPEAAAVDESRTTQLSVEAAELPDFEVVRKRAEEVSDDSPITYREFAYAVKAETTPESAKVLLWARFKEVQASIADKPPGKYVQLAVFDHTFERKPLRAPVATLAWKDWRGEPVLTLNDRSAPPASMPPSGPPSSMPPKIVVTESTDVDVDVDLGEVAPATQPAEQPKKPKAKRHKKGEDLIGELFETMHELHFLPDMVSGADFVSRIIERTLPCEAALLHVFDINARRFVVVRTVGDAAPAALLHSTEDRFPLFQQVMRRGHALHVENITEDERYRGGRWERAQVTPRDALCGPVAQGGRYLGMVELVNPVDGDPFYESEINALDYICEQFAEFLANRPLVLEADVVLPKKK